MNLVAGTGCYRRQTEGSLAIEEMEVERKRGQGQVRISQEEGEGLIACLAPNTRLCGNMGVARASTRSLSTNQEEHAHL